MCETVDLAALDLPFRASSPGSRVEAPPEHQRGEGRTRSRASHVGMCPLPRPDLPEPTIDPGQHLFELCLPAWEVYAICGGCRAPPGLNTTRRMPRPSYITGLGSRSAAVTLDDCFRMSTGLERPCGPSSGLPPALLSHEGTTALLPVLVGAPEAGPPGRPIPRRHSEAII